MIDALLIEDLLMRVVYFIVFLACGLMLSLLFGALVEAYYTWRTRRHNRAVRGAIKAGGDQFISMIQRATAKAERPHNKEPER